MIWMPTLKGIVVEKWSGVPISSAVVVVNGIQVFTDGAGRFTVNTPSLQAQVQVLHANHETLSAVVELSAGVTEVELTMTPTARFV